MNWQPIETAPKDGTPILLYCEEWNFDWHGDDKKPIIAVCRSGRGGAFFIDNTVYYETQALRPTHWMPLPPPPKE